MSHPLCVAITPPTPALPPSPNSASAFRGPTEPGLLQCCQIIAWGTQQKAIKSQLGWSFQSWWGSAGRRLPFFPPVHTVHLSLFNYSDGKYNRLHSFFFLSPPLRPLNCRSLTSAEENAQIWWHHGHILALARQGRQLEWLLGGLLWNAVKEFWPGCYCAVWVPGEWQFGVTLIPFVLLVSDALPRRLRT